MTFKDRVKSLRRVRSGDLIENPRNYRTHSKNQAAALRGVLDEIGFAGAVVARETAEGLELIDGHLRAELSPEDKIPVLVVDVTQKEADKILATFDPLGAMAGTDESALAELLDGLKFDDQAAQSLVDELGDGLFDQADPPEPEPPDPPENPTTTEGELIHLGRHRLLCGDTTDPADVARLVHGADLALVHADPPYGMGKEAEGIANDNLYAEKLDRFQIQWWTAWRPHLVDNASAYIWGNPEDLFRLWYSSGLSESEPLTFRNSLTWDKRSAAGLYSGNGIGAATRRQFAPISESCLFFTLGKLSHGANAVDYWDGWEPVRKYLNDQRLALDWTHDKTGDLVGVSSRMSMHWFNRSQWVFIRRDHYERLQQEAAGAGFLRPFDDLEAEFLTLRDEFEKDRPTFDNTHDNMTDVWQFPRVTGEDRFDHATPKPVAMAARVIKSSTIEGAAFGVPFAGTCPELIAAEQLGRTCFAMETNPSYCDVVVERWETLTDGKAKRQKQKTA